MATVPVKIQELPTATTINDNDYLIVDQSDATRKSLVSSVFSSEVDRKNKAMKFVMPEDFTGTDTDQLLSALSYAKANKVSIVTVPGKTYTLTGTTPLDIDLGYFSFGPLIGESYIDATGFTGSAAMWIHSSIPYTEGENNHLHTLHNVDLFGQIRTGQAGWLWGNNNNSANGTYNGDCHIVNCTVRTFDIRILCTNSTWRYKADNCGITSDVSGTYTFYAPAGLSDSGESISFTDCKIYDNKGNPFLIECANFAVGCPGASILNTPVNITGNGSVLSMTNMGNMENPGQQSWYRYASVTGVAARLIIESSTVVSNGPSLQTQSLFYVGTNAFIEFTSVKFPGNAYKFEQLSEAKIRQFVEGPGYVTANGCTADIGSGAGNIPIHTSLSPLYNFNFRTGTIDGWSFNNSGSTSQTYEVSSSYAYAGTYGVRMTSISTLSCFLSQRFVVGNAKYLTTSLWAKVVQAGVSGNVAGSISIAYYTYAGTQIAGPLASLPLVITDWAVYGSFLQGRIPAGAAYLDVTIRCREGAIIDIDSILLNIS